jgi:hypothetical protein
LKRLQKRFQVIWTSSVMVLEVSATFFSYFWVLMKPPSIISPKAIGRVPPMPPEHPFGWLVQLFQVFYLTFMRSYLHDRYLDVKTLSIGLHLHSSIIKEELPLEIDLVNSLSYYV